MSRIHLKRPSAGMAVAFVALLAALSGSAVALPGKNKVDSGDIKNGQVKSADIKNSGITGTDIKGNTVKGSDIDESSLGKVGSAASADSATTATTATSATTADTAAKAGSVNGNTIVKVNSRQDSGAPGVAIFNAGGLKISTSCIGGVMELSAATSKDNSALYISLDDLEGTPITDDFEGGGFDVGDNADLLIGTGGFAEHDPALVTFEFDALDGTVASGTLATDESGEVNDCLVTGHVIVG